MIVSDHLENIFPHSITDSPMVVQLAISNLVRTPAPMFAVTVDINDNRKWTLWLSDNSFKYIQHFTGTLDHA